MNAFLLLIPFLLIRFLFLGMLDKQAVSRAALFAPLEGTERLYYYIYQLATLVLFIYPFFIKVHLDWNWLMIIGGMIYLLGCLVCILATYAFARPEKNGLNKKGIYKFSRNPMYVGYFIYFFGLAVLCESLILFSTLALFQFSAHWIILSEERWCRQSFGKSYEEYCLKVRRYI